jgi:hypothetical protein
MVSLLTFIAIAAPTARVSLGIGFVFITVSAILWHLLNRTNSWMVNYLPGVVDGLLLSNWHSPYPLLGLLSFGCWSLFGLLGALLVFRLRWNSVVLT